MLDVALFNYQDGGRRKSDGTYDFAGLRRAFADVETAPALVLYCEAHHYRDNGNEGLHMAAEALSDELGVPYVGVLGWMRRGPLPPAVLYDPTRLRLRNWWNPDDPGVYDDARNVARFAVTDSGRVSEERTEFLAFVHHFDSRSGVVRRHEAERLDCYGSKEKLPVIGGGDFNATASGGHLPQRDWMAASYRARSHKGICRDGQWGPDTAAVDHLIGRWDQRQQRRVDGCGFHAVAELAWQADPDTPLLPTVNDGVDSGGGLLIDWLLVNDAMKPYVLPESYQVHVPDPTLPPSSDHRLVTASLNL